MNIRRNVLIAAGRMFILFLASREASGFITGEYIAVNGGVLMRP